MPSSATETAQPTPATASTADASEVGHASEAEPAPRPATGRERIGLWLLGALVLGLLFWRIAGFGIWDPWELNAADAARRLAAGEPAASGAVSFATWLVSLGFRAFGIHEWAGRLPIAASGCVIVGSAYLLGARYADARTGLYSGLITATTPLFVLNARTMVGAAPDIAIQSALGFACCGALLPAPNLTAGSERRRSLWLACALLLTALAVSTRGALLGALPPLGAAVLACLLFAKDLPPISRRLALPVLGLTWVGLALLVARDVARDAGEYSLWLGGHSSAAAPPTFDAVVEEVFHAFAPWSALLPVAIGRLWVDGLDSDTTNLRPSLAQQGLRSISLLWIAFGYGAQTLFLSRYGREATFLALPALAVPVALLLRRVERERAGRWEMGIAALFLAGLILRDYALYPQGPVQGLPIGSFELPKEWNPRGAWSALLAPFGLALLLGLGIGSGAAPTLDLRAPYRWLAAQWRRGWGFRAWLIAGALVLLGLCACGVLAYAIPGQLHLPTLALKWVRRLTFIPLAVALGCALVQAIAYAYTRWNAYRFVPVLLAATACGVYCAQFFLPRVSEHFSPREVYSVYNQLAGKAETLAEYRVGGRAAAYYAKGQVIDVASETKLIDHLVGPGRRWAAFPSDELAEIDRDFRRRTHRHLVLLDTHSARVMLASSLPIAGHRDENQLRDAVLKEPPAQIQHSVAVNFEDRVELLGYALDLPHDGYVGAGESLKLTWYFRVLHRIPSGYRLFVHIDGQGQRIHGDHDPIDGKYPVQLWDEGDIIADVQKIDVPASYRGGDYTVLMGFYSGDTRLAIKAGPNDGENRARVGVLRIQ